MLYPYRSAGAYPLTSSAVPEEAGRAGRIFLELVSGLSGLFDLDPVVFRAEGGRTLLLLYQDVSFSWRDVAEPCGAALADLSRLWPLAVCGTTGRRETAEVRVVRGERGLRAELSSVSGRPFDRLEGLCLRVEADTRETAGHLAALCAALSAGLPCAAVERSHEGFLRRWSLLEPTEGSLYCYVVLGEAGPEDRLLCLSAGQKEGLWTVFLQGRVQPKEFQWLWDAYDGGAPLRLLEWELTARAVLESLGFSVDNRAGEFQITDGAGQCRRYDFASGGPAEKLFLKLLFPVDRGRRPRGPISF